MSASVSKTDLNSTPCAPWLLVATKMLLAILCISAIVCVKQSRGFIVNYSQRIAEKATFTMPVRSWDLIYIQHATKT